MRKTVFCNDEYYHLFNQGVDKRNLFNDQHDFGRFLKSMEEFNNVETIGSIYENRFTKESKNKPVPLVEFAAYCLNPNHYHFLLKQVADKGIEKFMHRLGLGYAKYFNQKYQRRGSLYQGKFKAVHISDNDQLLYVSAYVNLNWKIHGLGNSVSKSSWELYMGGSNDSFCSKDIILGQFKQVGDYKDYATSVSESIRTQRQDDVDGDFL